MAFFTSPLKIPAQSVSANKFTLALRGQTILGKQEAYCADFAPIGAVKSSVMNHKTKLKNYLNIQTETVFR